MNSEKKPKGTPKNIHTPIKYFTEEQRKDAIRQSKTRYMVNKEWICNVCDNHNYSLSRKCKHLRTKQHTDAIGTREQTIPQSVYVGLLLFIISLLFVNRYL